MKTKKGRLLDIFLIAATLAAGTTSWAASPGKNDDQWTWNYLGEIENPPQLFPGTRLVKFRDTTSGVLCYVYTNKYVDARDFTNDGKTQDGVAGNQLGTMSCVREGR